MTEGNGGWLRVPSMRPPEMGPGCGYACKKYSCKALTESVSAISGVDQVLVLLCECLGIFVSVNVGPVIWTQPQYHAHAPLVRYTGPTMETSLRKHPQLGAAFKILRSRLP